MVLVDLRRYGDLRRRGTEGRIEGRLDRPAAPVPPRLHFHVAPASSLRPRRCQTWLSIARRWFPARSASSGCGPELATHEHAGDADWTPPEELDEYRLIRPLGHGGMGSVWLAEDRLLGRLVAVKLIAHHELDERRRARFELEARIAARLQHPNIVTVYRYGEVAGRPYLVSEYVRGQSLDELAKPVPWERALQLGAALARGLAAAHRHGIVHRDLKPANAILTAEGEAKLLDFGLAKLDPARGAALAFDGDPTGVLTEPGCVAGTPRYLAPEVRRGEPASRRSDVYQIGCILYELVTGRAPILDVLDGEVSTADYPAPMRSDPAAHRRGWIASHGELDAQVPSLAVRLAGPGARFGAVVDRCLRPNPHERYASGDELREVLEQLRVPELGGEQAEGDPVPRRPRVRCRPPHAVLRPRPRPPLGRAICLRRPRPAGARARTCLRGRAGPLAGSRPAGSGTTAERAVPASGAAANPRR